MAHERQVRIDDLQPSQLYVSRAKLDALSGSVAMDPVPVRTYDDRLVLLDGHTRALAAMLAGHASLRVVDDEDDDVDDEAYRICVAWCRDEGVQSVADLKARVVDPEAYTKLWLERCARMHRELAARRGGTKA